MDLDIVGNTIQPRASVGDLGAAGSGAPGRVAKADIVITGNLIRIRNRTRPTRCQAVNLERASAQRRDVSRGDGRRDSRSGRVAVADGERDEPGRG